MQIGRNTTGFPAELTLVLDKDGRDWCVVVVKGTFSVAPDGSTTPADEMVPPVAADEHYGDPATTAIRYECDFVRFKPKVDVLLVGHAVAPRRRPATELDVTLEIGSIRKTVRVFGNRTWQGGLSARASAPEPFESMPLNYGRSFGGPANLEAQKNGTEVRNPIGVGFYRRLSGGDLAGKPLPNLEDTAHPYRTPSDTPPPAGFGVIGRGWQPRVKFAGTYDQKWLDDRFPFLPADFDEQYFQSAPADQQLAQLKGGERITCTNVREDGPFTAVVPSLDIPLTFRFRGRDEVIASRPDTLIIEPDRRRLVIVWRGQVAMGRKLNALEEVQVGRAPDVEPTPPAKRHHESLKLLPAARRDRT